MAVKKTRIHRLNLDKNRIEVNQHRIKSFSSIHILIYVDSYLVGKNNNNTTIVFLNKLIVAYLFWNTNQIYMY